MLKAIPLALLLASTVARAESLEEKKYWKGQTDYIARDIADAEKVCGTKFTFEVIDKDKAKLREAHDKKNHTPNSVCSAPITSVALICRRGEDEKAAVRAKIKGFACGAGNPRALSLDKAGIVRFHGNLDEVNLHEWIRGWLEKAL